MKKLIKYILLDIVRNRIVLAYTLLLALITLSVFSLEDNAAKGQLTILNLILYIVPLVCIVFSTIYAYNSVEFIEMLLSQPVRRKTIWLSLFCGLSGALSLAFLAGLGVPLIFLDQSRTGILISLAGVFLTVIFVAIALLAAVKTRDKAKGIGVSVLLWMYFALLFDGIVLFVLFQFPDYPLEKTMVGITMLNPVDLARIMILLKMDISALMGYTGAVFREYFGTNAGISVSFLALTLWALLPFYFSLRNFNRKDL